jgi:hypothetical protein
LIYKKYLYSNIHIRVDNNYTTRKLEDSDRPFEAVSLEPSPLFLYQQLLRRFSTAAANKQLPTGNPRRF